MQRKWISLVAVMIVMALGAVGHSQFVNASDTSWIESEDEERLLRKFEDAAEAAGALGFYRDAASATLVVLVPASLAASFNLTKLGESPVPITIQRTSFDRAALDLVEERLTKFRDKLGPEGSVAFFFDPRSQRFEVVTTSPAADVLAAIGDSISLVSVQQGRVELASRFNDYSPFWGGSAIKYQGLTNEEFDCTSGFAMTNGTTKVLVTAAHCGPSNRTVLSPDNAREIGKTTFGRYCPTNSTGEYSNNADVQLISGKAYGNSIYVGNKTGSKAIVNHAAGDPAVGAVYGASGARTYEHSGLEVINLSGNIPNNACGVPGSVSNLITFAQIQGFQSACPLGEGDSGAPFFFKWAAPSVPEIGIRGMFIAESVPTSSGSVCFAMRYSKIQSVTGYWALTN